MATARLLLMRFILGLKQTLFLERAFSDADKCHSGSVVVTTGDWSMYLTEKPPKGPSHTDKNGNGSSRTDLFTLLLAVQLCNVF